jgi:hypothetical protein
MEISLFCQLFLGKTEGTPALANRTTEQLTRVGRNWKVDGLTACSSHGRELHSTKV